MIGFRKAFLFVFTLFALIPAVFAAGAGDEIPHDLSVKDQNGTVQVYEALAGEKGAVLVFVRSADWCPYCQVQLLDLKFDGSAITDLGYSIVIVSYDEVPKLKAFTDKYEYPYTMLSDQDSEIIKAFGVLNEDVDPKSFKYGIPNPAVFVVSREGIITHKLGDGSVRKRAAVDSIIAAIQ